MNAANPPIVSVLTRTKDRPDLLREAVASVAAQTLRGVEHVIVNDGGADVAHVLEPFRDRSAITYLSPGAVGRCRAGNLALAASKGRWLAWLDDDDIYYARHLETLVRFAEKTGSLVAYSMAHRITQSKDPATGLYADVATELAPTFEYSRLALWRGGGLHLVSMLYAREVHDLVGGFDESMNVLEDQDLFARMAEETNFRRCPEITCAYRIRDDRSNAVTALRHEFSDARRRLFARYAHIVLPELLDMAEHGGDLIGGLHARVTALEEEVRRLKDGK